MGRAKLADVARASDVSVSAASLVLNNRPSRIPPATAERVRKAAQELGYSPDVNARSLKGRRTKTIGLLSDRVVTTPFATGLIQGVQEAAWERGHLVLIANSEGDPERERKLVQSMGARRVDGYLYALMYHQEREVPKALVPELVVGLDAELPGRPSFIPDEVAGAQKATRHLIEAGHRRIAHIQGNPGIIASRLRAAAFEQEMRAAGLFDPELVCTPPVDRSGADSGFALEAMLGLLDLPDPPTAVFAFNDAMAVGVHRALWSRGLQVPEDISVVGFDDLQVIVDEILPNLTTVALPHREMGRLASQAVIDLVEGKRVAAEVHPVDCPLMVRGTVRQLG